MKIYIIIFIAAGLWTALNQADAAENYLTDNEGKITLSYIPMSYHWKRGKDYNEIQNGIGLGLGVGHGWTAGLARFRNSYDDMTTMFSMDKHIGCLKQICFGAGGGYAWGYKDHMVIPMAAWGTLRWKVIRLTFIPGVTALSFVFPVN